MNKVGLEATVFADFKLSDSVFQRLGAARENDLDTILVLNLGKEAEDLMIKVD